MRPVIASGPVTRAVTLVVALAASASCGTDDSPIYVDDAVGSPGVTSPPAPIVPATTLAPGTDDGTARLVVERAFSPENAIAELSGTGASNDDPVTVDGAPADIQSFETFPDGSFVVRVRIEDEGAHTVCVSDVCSRVFTRAPDADTPADVEAKIAEARTLAASVFDGESELDGWTVEVAGPLAGHGGSTDSEGRVITVYSNRGRSVEEFALTILHEWGHAVDVDTMTDDDRLAFRRLRGFADDAPWQRPGAHTVDEWSTQPGEDFAEVAVVVWTEGTDLAHTIRTSAPAGDPSDEAVEFVAALVTPPL